MWVYASLSYKLYHFFNEESDRIDGEYNIAQTHYQRTDSRIKGAESSNGYCNDVIKKGPE
jgi:hypothetical protein